MQSFVFVSGKIYPKMQPPVLSVSVKYILRCAKLCRCLCKNISWDATIWFVCICKVYPEMRKALSVSLQKYILRCNHLFCLYQSFGHIRMYSTDTTKCFVCIYIYSTSWDAQSFVCVSAKVYPEMLCLYLWIISWAYLILVSNMLAFISSRRRVF